MLEIALTKGMSTVVDDEDYNRLIRFPWFYTKSSRCKNTHTGYAAYHQTSKSKWVWMHRFILGMCNSAGTDLAPHMRVDHRDGNGLNNSRTNLRPCTRAQNGQNRKGNSDKRTSRYKGVFARTNGNWRAAIRVNNVLLCLGTYPDEEMAASVYNDAAVKYFGEFARLNNLQSIPSVIIKLPQLIGLPKGKTSI